MRFTTVAAIALAAALTFIFTFDTTDIASAQTGCTNTAIDMATVTGSWSSDCISQNRPNDAKGPGQGSYYARYFSLNVPEESEVTITLESTTDTYLYLLTSAGRDGTIIDENDDIERTARNYNSRITRTLSAGDYVIEATTYWQERDGDFTITIDGVDFDTDEVSQPTPDPSPSPTPDPTPVATPTIPDGCSVQTFSGTSAEGSWSSGCVSQNRTARGDHYARFYKFSASRTTTYDLTLESETDPYLILLGSNGDIIEENDDVDENNDIFGIGFPNSGIRIVLDPGDYIVEATTYDGSRTGDFTLTITEPELVALQALYNDTDGANWTNNDNWMSDEPLSDWHGVTTDDEGRVTEIYLIGNNLDGEIPSELGNISELEGLYLARNELSGSIPSELGDLSNLEVLMLFNNELTGSIPAEIGNISSLEEIHLGRNELSGSIPSELGDLANLRRLHLTVNDLSGSIPSSLGNLSNLRQLSIAKNNLTGSIPAGIADLSQLTHIYLYDNDLSGGAFIDDLDDLTNLQWLDIGGNRIDGSDVLDEIHALTKLTGLGIHDSDLNDTELQGSMSDLRALDLEFLNISGNDLDDLQTLVQLSEITTIQRLAIHGNDFSGELPSAMTKLTLMRLFYFHDNDGLCAPTDDDFQDWLDGINDVRGDDCNDSNGAGQSAASSAAAQAAQSRSSPSATMQEDSLTLQDYQQ